MNRLEYWKFFGGEKTREGEVGDRKQSPLLSLLDMADLPSIQQID